MLAGLRAEANGDNHDAEWLQPDAEELSRVFAEMDTDGDATVSLVEFQDWWRDKGGWEWARDPSRW